MQLSIVIEPTSAEFYFRMYWALGRPNLSKISILEPDPSSVQAQTPFISGEPFAGYLSVARVTALALNWEPASDQGRSTS